MNKLRLATVWMDGCSGCHMSVLDTDEFLIELAQKAELVFSPLVDNKEFPPDVDLTLVEGAVSSEEDLERIHRVRSRTKMLVALGDCAATGNVPSMRNPFNVECVLKRAYVENADIKLNRPGTAEGGGAAPDEVIPRLLPKVKPVHDCVSVDLFIPGCPPSAEVIKFAIGELLEGRVPDLGMRTRFGA